MSLFVNREKKVLSYANLARWALKLDDVPCIYPGERQDPCACPISNTISAGSSFDVQVDPWTIDVYNDAGLVFHDEVPKIVRDWIADFDRGAIPELVA